MMHRSLALAAVIGCVACSSSTDGDTGPAAADESPLGGDRPVEPLLPSGYDPATPAPLLVLLHGFGASGLANDLLFAFASEVDTRGFIYLRPDGTINTAGQRFWNATNGCCNFEGSDVDDVAYIQSLIDEARGRYNITRVALFGHSNGGFMAHRFGCDHAGSVDAIVSLAGSTWQDADKCQPDATVEVLQIHGTEDDTVPFEGVPDGDFAYPGAAETVARWAQLNGCDGDLETLAARDFSPQVTGEETKVSNHPNCQSGGAAQLWAVEGEGHVPFFNDAWRNAVLDLMLAP